MLDGVRAIEGRTVFLTGAVFGDEIKSGDDGFAGIAGGDDAVGDVGGDDGTGADDAVLTDGDAGENDAVCSDECPAPDLHGSDAAVSEGAMHGGVVGEHANAGSEGDVVADLDQPTDTRIKGNLLHDRTILSDLKAALDQGLERYFPAQSLNEPTEDAHGSQYSKNPPTNAVLSEGFCMVGPTGFEPVTVGLKGHCSTN